MRSLVVFVALVAACQPLQSNVPRADARPDGACPTGMLGDDANCGACGRRCASGDFCAGAVCALALPAPRPVAPLSGAVTRAERPRLRWARAAGADGARATLCRDRAMRDGCVTVDAVGDAAAPDANLARGVWFWRLASRAGEVVSRAVSPTWQLRLGTVDDALGATLDTDGDGRVELAVSAPRAVGGAGRVYVYEDFPGDAPPVRIRALPATGVGQFGETLAHLGDVNGDGYSDLVAGTFEGNRASVYLGGGDGLRVPPTALQGGDALERFGSGAAGVGDVNGDGYDDLAVAARPADGAPGLARVFLGGPDGVATEAAATLTTQGLASLDVTIAAAGDVNGDGFADVALGAYGASGNAGAVHVFYGGAAGLAEAPAATLVGTDVLGQFGRHVAAAGDVNGDGYADLFVGAPEALERRGKVVVFHGGEGGPRAAATIEGPALGAVLGRAIARGADLDGDGYPELVVSAEDFPVYVGSVRVYRGGPAGIARAPWLTREGLDGVDSSYAHALLAADVTHDGRVDLVVSSPAAGSNHGRVYVYPGVPGGFAVTPLPLSGTDGAQAVFGWALACAPRPQRRVDAFSWL